MALTPTTSLCAASPTRRRSHEFPLHLLLLPGLLYSSFSKQIADLSVLHAH